MGKKLKLKVKRGKLKVKMKSGDDRLPLSDGDVRGLLTLAMAKAIGQEQHGDPKLLEVRARSLLAAGEAAESDAQETITGAD